MSPAGYTAESGHIPDATWNTMMRGSLLEGNQPWPRRPGARRRTARYGPRTPGLIPDAPGAGGLPEQVDLTAFGSSSPDKVPQGPRPVVRCHGRL